MRDLAASPTRRRSPTLPARWRTLAVATLALLPLAGCGLIMGLVETEQKLADAGIQNPSIDAAGGGVVTLTYDPAGGPLDIVDQQDTAAQIIWTNLPLRVDQLDMVPNARNAPLGSERTYTRAQLESMFGPRPEGLDQELGDTFRNIGIAVGVGALVVLLLAVLIVILVVRAVRKRRQQPQPAYAWQGPGGQAWPPPPAGTWPPQPQQPPPPQQRPAGYGEPPTWQAQPPPQQPPAGYGQPPAWQAPPPGTPPPPAVPPGAAPPPWQPGAPPARPEQPPPPGTGDPWWSPSSPAGTDQDREGEDNGPSGRREPPPPAPPT